MCVWGQVKLSAPHLFSGSEDEEGGDKEDGGRFDIRPQFEGRAGQKVRKGVHAVRLRVFSSYSFIIRNYKITPALYNLLDEKTRRFAHV